MRIQIAPSLPWKLLAKAEALVAAVERVQALADDLESRADAIEEANPTHTTQIALHRQNAAMIRQALETP
ncbi:hypothetical protein [Rhodococcus baikonurensis]|uniref:Uncharacterized protein n=1 Tax=Rhodococcus baikonurensis TaxID=172041 RepID=A0ABV5X8X6_9NOCA